MSTPANPARPAHPYLRFGPQLKLGPGLGVHPSRQDFTPSPRLARAPDDRVADALRRRADAEPERERFFFLDLEGRLSALTNAGMLEWSGRVAQALHRRGVAAQDRVALCFDTCPELLASFFGCALIGATPLLAEPPRARARHESWRDRMRRTVERSGARALVVADEHRELSESVAARHEALSVLGPDDCLVESTPYTERAPTSPEQLAFIQFSSGTTSEIKGVMATHRAVACNVRSMGARARYLENEMTVGWLPLHHDMGLLGTVLWPLFHGTSMLVMPPMSFVLRPQSWLWALHYTRGNMSPAPNFGYQMCVNRIPERELDGLDLSDWRLALNGAEFIHARTIRQFAARFEARGFRPRAHYPVYGMAEVVVAATFPEPGAEPRVDSVSRERLSERGELVPAPPEDDAATEFVSVGRPFPEHAVKIVDEDGRELPERRQGQILLRGPSVCAGYVNQDDMSARVFRDGWLWTGDLGYLSDGELFISGRIKDLIIKGGSNYHPHAFEDAAGRVPGVRAGGAAAFGLRDAELGTERVYLVVETKLVDSDQRQQLRKQVEKAVYSATGLKPDKVLVVLPRTIPKTSSGKTQRALLARRVLEGRVA